MSNDADTKTDALAGLRELDDPRTIRALAHPIRLALMEALALREPLTATDAGELIGETPSNCSFHLRQLAKYGFVEEADGGRGRQRPWRRRTRGTRLRLNPESPSTAIATRELAAMFRERSLQQLRRWDETEADYPQRWRELADTNQGIWWVTADELEALNERVVEIVMSHAERNTDRAARPPGAVPVQFLSFVHPLELPADPDAPPTDVPAATSRSSS